jgi:hypothetical protein
MKAMATPAKKQCTSRAQALPTLTKVIFDHIMPDWKGDNSPVIATVVDGKPAYECH